MVIDIDTELQHQVKLLDAATVHMAEQAIPQISVIANEKRLETKETMVDEKLTVTITATEFWTIIEACGAYKCSIQKCLDKERT